MVVTIRSGFPKEFKDNSKFMININQKFSVNAKINELSIIDLDGDGTTEYIALVSDEQQNFFAKCLLNSNFDILSFLTVFMEKYDNFQSFNSYAAGYMGCTTFSFSANLGIYFTMIPN